MSMIPDSYALGRSVDDGDACLITCSSLLRVVRGMLVATKTPEDVVSQLIQLLSRSNESTGTAESNNSTSNKDDHDVDIPLLSNFSGWLSTLKLALPGRNGALQQLARVALGVAFLREKSRQDQSTSAEELEQVADLIFEAFRDPSLARFSFTASRSAQGFLAIPLCSILKDGRIDELFRLHIWLPDGQRGVAAASIHSHQPFAQSWILAGRGKNHAYKVVAASNNEPATHSEYALSWSDGKSNDTNYKTHQTSSTVVNTGKLVHTTRSFSETHTRDTSYVVPAATFHSTEVAPDDFHATLFFFDSSRGFVKDAGILGPIDGDSFTQLRGFADFTPKELVDMVGLVRYWERLIRDGQIYAQRADWEHALRVFLTARSVCQERFPAQLREKYLAVVFGELGKTNRRFGRYQLAAEALETALDKMDLCALRVELDGELGVVYRHTNRLDEAKRMFQTQYKDAKQLQSELDLCRAIGNLGMVNYQIFQDDRDETLLQLAIEQLKERVSSARSIQENIQLHFEDEHAQYHWKTVARTWEAIGLARLSLCYHSQNDAKAAIAAASDSMRINSDSEDNTVKAISNFIYGRALVLDNRIEEALNYFHEPTACLPVIAFCKEPSDEHLRYLQELMDAGVDFNVSDEQGYTALDHAVFSGDDAAVALVLKGLRAPLGAEGELQLSEQLEVAKLRKAYREIFQEKLRPALLTEGKVDFQSLRKIYAAELENKDTRNLFDDLRYLPYTDFVRFGKLPCFQDNLTMQISQTLPTELPQFVIFFSYRWMNTRHNLEVSQPDDISRTQYQRMGSAVEELLSLRPYVDRQRVGLWIDYACIDQEDPRRGVSALPMLLAQCDAVISLVDDTYYQRAWCSVEVLIVQALKKAYKTHLWYEQVCSNSSTPEEEKKWILREAPKDLEVDMAQKELSFEQDRSKVLFLERQSKLLG